MSLPLVGHQRPLLSALVHELPYVPETIQRIQDSDRRLSRRPRMYVKGNRRHLNKLAGSHGGLPQSFQQIREGGSLTDRRRGRSLVSPFRVLRVGTSSTSIPTLRPKQSTTSRRQ